MTDETDQQSVYTDIWAKVVDTQMHFNDMSVKSRQFGLAFVAAALGLAIALLSKGEEFSFPVHLFGGFDLHATVLIILASAFALHAVRILDLNVYHKMLRGAVTFGEDFEENYMKQIFKLNLGMTQAISHYSRHDDADKKLNNGKYDYTGSSQVTALDKIRSFYNTAILTLIGFALVVFVFTANFGHPIAWPRSTPSAAINSSQSIQPIAIKLTVQSAPAQTPAANHTDTATVIKPSVTESQSSENKRKIGVKTGP